MSFNLKLDSNNDIIINNGAERVAGIHYIAQLVKNRLSTILSEWELDTSIGIDWYNLLGRNYDVSLIQGVVTQTIRDTDGVTQITSVSVKKLPDRRMQIDFSGIGDGAVFTDTITI